MANLKMDKDTELDASMVAASLALIGSEGHLKIMISVWLSLVKLAGRNFFFFSNSYLECILALRIGKKFASVLSKLE